MSKDIKKEIMNLDKLVGTNIKIRRLILGISLNDMKTQIGTSRQQLNNYENGKNRIPSGKLYTFAKVLDVPINYFFKDIEESKLLIKECKTTTSLIKAFRTIENRESRKKLVELAKLLAEESQLEN